MRVLSPLPLVVAVLATVLAGCVQHPTRYVASAPIDGDSPLAALDPAEQAGSDGVPADGATAEPAAVPVEGLRPQITTGTGQFYNEQAARRVAPIPAPGDVTFNFEGEAIQAVIKAILGDFLQENYVIAPGVQGTVTFSTARPINAAQARTVLEYLLAQNGLAMVHRDGRYTVLPVAQAIPGNLSPRSGGAAPRGFEVRVVPLRFVAATEMEKLLAPFVKQGGIVRADNARSLLLLAGNGADLTTYMDTIEVFDVDWLKGMSVGIFPLERVEAATVAPELEKVFGEGSNSPLAGMFRFLPIERMNAILVITPQPSYLKKAEEWLGRLDRGGADAGTQLFVYYVKNVKAADLAENLTDVFGGSTGSKPAGAVSGGSVVPGTESVEIRNYDSNRQQERDRDIAQGKVAPPPAGLVGAAPVAATGDGIAIRSSDDIRITAIEESNALLIRATAGQYDSILRAIKRLDTVPLQVHIEARVLQVVLKDDLSFGVQWFFENARPDLDPLPVRPDNDVWKTWAGTIAGGGLGWTFVTDNIDVIVNTLEDASDVKVVAAPSLVVLNNKQASINVGTQIPVVSSFVNSGVGGGIDNNFNQSYVQFRDTGVTLDVTPRVNPGGLVFMEIKQEQSNPGPASAAVAGNVPVDKRTIQTEVAVQSGETVLLGGLIREGTTTGQAGVPFLSRIPVLGGLFGNQTRGWERQELLVMITPTVIENVQDARDVTDDYKARFKGLKPLESILIPQQPVPAEAD
jgi:general secretion pathway protein D